MALSSRVEGGLYINGNLGALSITYPAGGITDAAVAVGAGIQANKLVRHDAAEFVIDAATTIAATTRSVHIVRGTVGTLVAFKAAITGAIATGSDRTVTVDLQKSTGGGAFATVLSAPITFTHSSTLLTVSSATISTAPTAANDILAVVITVAGSASAQATGLHATATFEEAYQ
jgi:hypothetical protein